MTKVVSHLRDTYDSIAMLHPDGKMMCRCSRKKVDWYLQRGLAKKIDEHTFQLTFEPKGHGYHGLPYYMERKENKCVVCGSEFFLSRHHVVPYAYKTLFPVELKSNDHHDVQMLCRDCHDEYETEADKLKIEFLKTIGYDMTEINRIRRHNGKIKGAKRFLQQVEAGKLTEVPADRMQVMLEAAAMEKIPEPNWKDLFLAAYSTPERIHEFCTMWRKHFLETAKPKYISKHFDIEHQHEPEPILE